MANRERNIRFHFRATPHESECIREKMALAGIRNTGAYFRKMAIDGYVINLDLSEVQELSRLLQRYGGNLNQIAKRVNETSRIYAEDISDMQQQQEELLESFQTLLETLSAL